MSHQDHGESPAACINIRAGVFIDGDGTGFNGYLLTKEVRDSFGEITSDVWDIPVGYCRCGESIIEAAHREVIEKTGFDVKIGNICHIGQSVSLDDPYVAVIFSAEMLKKVENLDPYITRSMRWATRTEIQDLANNNKLRNPDLVLGCLRGYRGTYTAFNTCNHDLFAVYPRK